MYSSTLYSVICHNDQSVAQMHPEGGIMRIWWFLNKQMMLSFCWCCFPIIALKAEKCSFHWPSFGLTSSQCSWPQIMMWEYRLTVLVELEREWKLPMLLDVLQRIVTVDKWNRNEPKLEKQGILLHNNHDKCEPVPLWRLVQHQHLHAIRQIACLQLEL